MAYALYCADLEPSVDFTCSVGWQWMPVAEPLDMSLISASDVAAVFGAGFFLPLPLMAVAFGLGILLKSIRRI